MPCGRELISMSFSEHLLEPMINLCTKSYPKSSSLTILRLAMLRIDQEVQLYTLVLPLNHAAHLWSVHCKCALMQKQQSLHSGYVEDLFSICIQETSPMTTVTMTTTS